MSRFRVLSGTAAVLVGSALVYSYAWRAPQAPEAAGPQRLKPAMRAPVDAPQGKKAGKINGQGAIRYTAEGPSAIELRDVPRAGRGSGDGPAGARRQADRVAFQRRAGGGRDGRREGAEEERLRAELRRLAEAGRPQDQAELGVRRDRRRRLLPGHAFRRDRASRPRPRGRAEPRDRGRQHGLRGVRQAGPVSHGSDPVRHLLRPHAGRLEHQPGRADARLHGLHASVRLAARSRLRPRRRLRRGRGPFRDRHRRQRRQLLRRGLADRATRPGPGTATASRPT